MALLAACIAISATSALAAGGPVEIMVDPAVDGLAAAQLQARAAVAAGRDAVVTLRPGTHHLTTALRFGGVDSANGRHPVQYRADPSAAPGTVAVSGGAPLPLGCFKPSTTQAATPGLTIYKCELPADFPAKSFEQLFVNGKRCPRARFPDFDPLDSTVDGTGYANVKNTIKHPDNARWGSLSDSGITVETVSFSNRPWDNPANNATMHIFPWGHASWGILIYDGIVRTTDAEAGTDSLTWQRGGWHINTHEFPNGDKPHGGGRFFVEGIREEMDAPFEWFLDSTQRTVEIVAPAGLDMAHAVVVAPLVEQPFEHVGAANVHISGLNITHTGAQYMYPYDNPSRGDWTIGRGGAVYFEDATNCSVTDCIFDQVGSNGVMVNERNSRISVERCRFIAAGASGVAFVGNRHKAHGTYAAYPNDCCVKNCFMAGLGYYDKQVAGVFISNAQRINCSHNMIRNVPRAGILMNDGLVGGHDIAYNSVWNSVRDTSDHGPFNSWGRERYWDLGWSHGDPGGVFPSIHSAGKITDDIAEPVLLRSNLLAHGPQSSDYACADLDDGSSNIVTASNIMIGCAMKNREGDLRKTYNNLIMGDEMNQAVDPHNFRFELTMMNNTDEWKWNIMLDCGKQPHMTAVSPANIRYVDEAQPILPKVNDLNCIENEFIAPTVSAHGYGNPGGGASWSYNQSTWHALGMDANSVFAPDIKLDRQTFQLASDSPCLKIPGLTQLDTRFGLEPLPWSSHAAVFNVRTSRCSAKNSGQVWNYAMASGRISLLALGSEPTGCLMTESILIEAGLSTAVYPCEDEGRLGLGQWELASEGNSTTIKLRQSVLTSQSSNLTSYCLGAWIARGVSNARLVSCDDPSAKWGGVHKLASGGFHLAAATNQAASPPQQTFAATECLDACHKRECVLDTAPAIIY